MSYKTKFSDYSGWTAVDTNIKLTRSQGKGFINFLKSNNVETVIRYYASSQRSKTISKDEAKLICDNGFKLLPVYQDVARKFSDFGSRRGKSDARNALRFAEYIEQPLDTTIMFACDADFSQKEYDRYIKAYFVSVNNELENKYRVGAYGSGLILKNLLKDGLIEVPWISMSRGFRGTEEFFFSDDWAMRQVPMPMMWGSVYHYDRNVVRWSWNKIGAFSYNDDVIKKEPEPDTLYDKVVDTLEDWHEDLLNKFDKLKNG